MSVPDWRQRRLASGLALALGVLGPVLGVPALVLLDLNSGSAGLGGAEPASRVASIAVNVTLAAVGAGVAWRRPSNAIGWLIWVSGGLGVFDHLATQYAIYALGMRPNSGGAGASAAWMQSWVWIAQFAVTACLFFLFPDGRPASPRWRLVAWATLMGAGLLFIGFGFAPGELANRPYALPPMANPYGLDVSDQIMQAAVAGGFVVLTGGLLAAVASQLLRFRTARGERRQQLKWFAYAVALMGLWISENFILNILGSPLLGTPVHTIPGLLAYAAIPAAAGIAILQYRLYDIDVIINRTVVYGTLTAGVVGVYVLVVGALGTRLQASGNLVVSLLATALVAVLFQPVRERLQRGVNRLLYGERDEPYTVLSRLGRRLEAVLAADAVMPLIVETVARALKVPYAAIALERTSGPQVVAAYGAAVADGLRIPLIYRTETVGQLILGRRGPGERFGPADQRLLDDLARQAGVAVHAAQLTVDLQHSREQLVTAREEERRRLRRDLHDGLGPVLAAQTLKVGSARAMYPHEPVAAAALLGELETDLGSALLDIRRLVYDLRPPALDELGLVGAIREGADRYRTHASGRATDARGLDITVEAPAWLPPLTAAVEVAAYRIVQEALTNIVRHADARIGRVCISLNGAFQVEITDDGVGLPSVRHAGIGLVSMRERAEELGGTCIVERRATGGTRVLARLPLQ